MSHDSSFLATQIIIRIKREFNYIYLILSLFLSKLCIIFSSKITGIDT